MTPKQPRTQPGNHNTARTRRLVAEKYLEIAVLLGAENDGVSINTTIGNRVLAGIAASDAICIAATGERYAGQDHMEAADLLGRIDSDAGKWLRDLIKLKSASHYGDKLLTVAKRDQAVKRATALVEAARTRTI